MHGFGILGHEVWRLDGDEGDSFLVEIQLMLILITVIAAIDLNNLLVAIVLINRVLVIILINVLKILNEAIFRLLNQTGLCAHG